jgi:hypothetical protein
MVKTAIAARIITDGFGHTLHFIITGHAPTAVLRNPKQAQQSQSKHQIELLHKTLSETQSPCPNGEQFHAKLSSKNGTLSKASIQSSSAAEEELVIMG